MSPAAAKSADHVVEYRGQHVVIPASWPVFDLSADPSTCVRFNRHALYLGTPSADARCPVHAVGRTEAILIEPAAGPERVEVTATWSRHPSTIRRALPDRSLASLRAAAPRPEVSAQPAEKPAPRAAVFTGLGFDACAAPSSAAMDAWGASPYRAVGIYIGGENRGCAQPNLSAAWVGEQVAAGWQLIPTYVGKQAPLSSCDSCTSISPSNAAAQGAAAANAAAGQAQALGIPAGNPIYYDMEYYSRGPSSTPTALTFLSAWTTQLHALGYVSGVYSSASSGITDLVDHARSGGVIPDAIWIANWNKKRTTDDPYVPADLWANQQRIHQYQGGHNETYGGVTINIDSNYLDGPTADTAAGSPPTEPPPSPVECVVPRVKGLKVAEARGELRGAHCTLGEVKRPRHRVRHRVLLITRQRPDPGKHLADRSPVNLTVKWRRR
jgi:hypothetical protein